MRDDRVAALHVVEGAQIEVDRVCGPRGVGIGASQRCSKPRKERAWRKETRDRQRRARDARDDCRPTVEGDAVDEPEMRDAIRMSNGERLCDTSAEAVADNT